MRNIKSIVALIAILSIMLMGSCDFAGNGSGDVETPGPESLHSESVTQPTVAPANDKEAIAMASLEERFSGKGTVTVDDYLLAFYILPYGGQDFVDTMVLAKQGDADARSEWNWYKLNILAMSRSITEYLMGYSIILLDPVNPDYAYLNVTNGEVIVNVID